MKRRNFIKGMAGLGVAGVSGMSLANKPGPLVTQIIEPDIEDYEMMSGDDWQSGKLYEWDEAGNWKEVRPNT